jgi:hypothetical protein
MIKLSQWVLMEKPRHNLTQEIKSVPMQAQTSPRNFTDANPSVDLE